MSYNMIYYITVFKNHLDYDVTYKFITNGFPINLGVEETETFSFNEYTFLIKISC